MKFDDVIGKRVSVRDFSGKKVKWADVLEAIDAANQAPFAGNINHLKFVVVEGSKIINEIAKQCQQDWVSDSSLVVVVCSDDSRLDSYDDRGHLYAKQQSGAAIENFLLKIADLGLASCWIGAYNESAIKQALSVPEKINIEAVLPIGYAKKVVKNSRKLKLESTVYWDKWEVDKRPVLAREPETW